MAQDDVQARRARLQALKAKHQQLDQSPPPETPEFPEQSPPDFQEPPFSGGGDVPSPSGMRRGPGLFQNRRMGEGDDPQTLLERFPRLRQMLAQRQQQGRGAGFGGGMGRGGRFRAALDGETEPPARPAPPSPRPAPEAAPLAQTLDDDIAMSGESSPPFSTFSPEMLRRYRAQLEKRIAWLEEALDKGLKELELIDKLQKR